MIRRWVWILVAALLACPAACGWERDAASPHPDREPAPPVLSPPDETRPLTEALPVDFAARSFCRLQRALNGRATVTISNDLLALEIDADTGAVSQLFDLRADPPLRLLSSEAPMAPLPAFDVMEIVPLPIASLWVVTTLEYPAVAPEIKCDDATLTLQWAPPGDWPAVEALWELTPNEPEARVWVRVADAGGRFIHSVRYPILPGLAPLSGDGTSDQFLLSLEGGLLLFNPFERLREEILDWSSTLRQHRYPTGHEAMAQLEAYLHPGVGGLLLYTADAGFGVKQFEFTNRPVHNANSVAWQVVHLNPDIAAGDFDVGYPTVLRWLDQGTWDEAAAVYRAWSDQQVWAGQPLAARDPAEREFFEHVGATVFGLSARLDQQSWIAAFHDELAAEIPGAQLLYVLGWDFHPFGVPEPRYFTALQQAGWDEAFWRPFAGRTYDNLAQIQQQGDLAALFYYDLVIHPRVPGWDGFRGGFHAYPPAHEPFDQHVLIGSAGLAAGFTYYDDLNQSMVYSLDPADAFVQDFWLWRDTLLVNETNPPLDALYFDLGFTIAARESYDLLAGLDQGHPSGAGRWLIQSVRDVLDTPRGTPNPRGYRHGAENVTEPYVDLVDFWHLGGPGLGPLRNKVADTEPPEFTGSSAWIMNGVGFDVPLMQFLNHHNGALRTGGKLMASDEIGDVFYWIVAAEYVWGGVVELIYFNTPVDWLPSLDPLEACQGRAYRCGYQTGWSRPRDERGERGWYANEQVREADPDKLAFLREAIALRLDSPATPYLTLGRMEAPPDFAPEPALVPFTYSFYGSLQGPECYHAGEWWAPPVQRAAWRHPEGGTVAILLANTDDQPQAVNVIVAPADYGLSRATWYAVDWQTGRRQMLAVANGGDEELDHLVTLPPRSFQMYELVPGR